MNGRRRIASWALAAFIINVLAALNGVFVRASGSGAGCGRTWPFCFDQVLPPSLAWPTLVEYGHRIISALAFLSVFYVFWLVRRAYAPSHPLRKAALASAVFIVTEVLAGASLVIFDWVVYNLTWGRVIVMAVHLTNTLLLIAAVAVTAWLAYNPEAEWPRLEGAFARPWLVGLLLLLLTSLLGAQTALNEVVDHWERVGGMPPAFVGPAQYVRSIVWVHIGVAVLTTLYLTWAVLRFRLRETPARTWATVVVVAAWLQLALGSINWWLVRLNITTQILHLAVAYTIWVAWWYLWPTRVLQYRPVSGWVARSVPRT